MINERPAARYAISIGMAVVTVPTIIVTLRSQGVISNRAARRKLELIASNTARDNIIEALRRLDQLG